MLATIVFFLFFLWKYAIQQHVNRKWLESRRNRRDGKLDKSGIIWLRDFERKSTSFLLIYDRNLLISAIYKNWSNKRTNVMKNINATCYALFFFYWVENIDEGIPSRNAVLLSQWPLYSDRKFSTSILMG